MLVGANGIIEKIRTLHVLLKKRIITVPMGRVMHTIRWRMKVK